MQKIVCLLVALISVAVGLPITKIKISSYILPNKTLQM